MNSSDQHPGINIFKYLEELAHLGSTTRRDIRQRSKEEKLVDIPSFTRSKNLYVKPFDGEDEGDIILSVKKERLEPIPSLPPDLEEWVIFNDNSFQVPTSKEYLVKEEYFRDDSTRRELHKKLKNGDLDSVPPELEGWVVQDDKGEWNRIKKHEVKRWFSDYPSLQESFHNYVNGPWADWKERNYPIDQTNILYDKLFGLRNYLQNLGEEVDLLWTHDILTWNKEGENLYHPFFFTPVQIDFSPEKETIYIVKQQDKTTFFESSFIEDLLDSNLEDIQKQARVLNTEEYSVWNFEALSLKGSELVNLLSSEGVNQFTDEQIVTPTIESVPQYWNYPTLFLRKRSPKQWAEYARAIQDDIEEQTELPPFIRELAGEDVREDADIENSEKNQSSSDSELYFPLPYNQEQKQIAKRIDNRYGVVVKGPPGTGKSHTIANLLSRFLAQGKSVLVTSKTGKALEVVREKLPEEVQNLAVSHLQHSERGSDIKTAVDTISNNLSETGYYTEENIQKTKNELKNIREEINKYVQRVKRGMPEQVPTTLTLQNGKSINVFEGMKMLETGKEEEKAWLPDGVHYSVSLNFSEQDIEQAKELLKELSPEERQSVGLVFPDLDNLPDLETIQAYCEDYKSHKNAKEQWENFAVSQRFRPDMDHFSRKKSFSDLYQKLNGILEPLQNAKDFWLEVANRPAEKQLLSVILNNTEEKTKWEKNILPQLESDLALIRDRNKSLMEYTVEYDTSISLKRLVDGIGEILEKLGSKDKLGFFQRKLLSKRAKYIIETSKVDGECPEKTEEFLALQKRLERDKAIEEMKTVWRNAFYEINVTPAESEEFVLHTFEEHVNNLKRIVQYPRGLEKVKAFVHKTFFREPYGVYFEQDIDFLISSLQNYTSYLTLQEYDKIFERWKSQLISNADYETVAPLLEGLDEKDSQRIEHAFEDISVQADKKRKAMELNKSRDKICTYAPRLFEDIDQKIEAGEEVIISNNLEEAWDLARIESWLGHIYSDNEMRRLEDKLYNLKDQEREAEKQLVVISSWTRLKERVTKAQKEALAAYAQNIKRLGKGTGKHAHTHRKRANEALQIAKDAVPIWIMSIDDVLHMFSQPKAGMFDVVIFDESSQVDVRGLNIAYLGQQQIAVGDPEQISPQSFTKEEQVDSLIEKYLTGIIPHAEQFSEKSSFFDVMNLKLSDTITLKEHFRSVKEIIGFSNKHFYNQELNVLRSPDSRYPLKPALESFYVEEGYMNPNNKMNEPEAEAIVDKLEEILNEPEYQYRDAGNGNVRPTTFGIITLLGPDQGKYLQELIQSRISAEEIEKRRITVGNPYMFQGDERDVALLSMVKDSDPERKGQYVFPLIDKPENRQHINVAMSRARDKMILFHSLMREELNGNTDWRAAVIDWFQEYSEEKREEGKQALKEQERLGRASPFSVEVGEKLIDAGYRVIPEYEVAGYRIDLVVEDDHEQIGIECDGDQYHTPNNWQDDIDREEVLKRAGWDIWRITGSAYYQNREEAMNNLWEKLAEKGIKPTM